MNDFNFQGLYSGEISGQSIQPASTGTPQIVLTVRVLSKVDDNGNHSPVADNIERKIWMSLTQKTKGFVQKDLEAIGFKGQPSQIMPGSNGHIDLTGNECRLWCKQEQGTDGQMRERWSISRPREAVAPLDISQATLLDAEFGDVFGQAAGDSSSTPQPTVGNRVGPDLSA